MPILACGFTIDDNDATEIPPGLCYLSIHTTSTTTSFLIPTLHISARFSVLFKPQYLVPYMTNQQHSQSAAYENRWLDISLRLNENRDGAARRFLV